MGLYPWNVSNLNFNIKIIIFMMAIKSGYFCNYFEWYGNQIDVLYVICGITVQLTIVIGLIAVSMYPLHLRMYLANTNH